MGVRGSVGFHTHPGDRRSSMQPTAEITLPGALSTVRYDLLLAWGRPHGGRGEAGVVPVERSRWAVLCLGS